MIASPGPLLLTLVSAVFFQASLNVRAEPEEELDLPEHTHAQYIVVGAGPAGLQMGFFLDRAGRDYLVLEKANSSGTFFSRYPRHDMLISINKRHTGKMNKEFNLRHDWNSLLSDDESLLFTKYSRELFPQRHVLVRYLDDYQRKLGLRVRFNTQVTSVIPTKSSRHRFVMRDQHGAIFTCSYLILATGMWRPNDIDFPGKEYTESYHSMNLDPESFEGQSVLILGRGNSAFELADSIYGHTNVVHMLGRSRVRLSWETHYVGDLRAVNNGLLDTYQLKSLDGVLEGPVDDLAIVKGDDGLLYAHVKGPGEAEREEGEQAKEGAEGEVSVDDFDNFALRDGYHRVVRCLGWTFDDSIFLNKTVISRGKGKRKKFPLILPDFQSADVSHLYFAGTNTHSLDFRQSAGGFIHGFRYTTKALHQMLEWRNHAVQWPSRLLSTQQLLAQVVKRINEASGIYQMFGQLGDVIAIRNGGLEFEYFEAFPLKLLPLFSKYTGREIDEGVIAVVMEYGPDFSGPGKDPFHSGRATGEPAEAHRSNFLHPVFYHFKQLPSIAAMKMRGKSALPRPDHLHHLVEDFLTDFTAPNSHVLPLRRFLETCLGFDLRQGFAEDCARLGLTHASMPLGCADYLADGHGLLGGHDTLFALEMSESLLV